MGQHLSALADVACNVSALNSSRMSPCAERVPNRGARDLQSFAIIASR